ncbi:type IV pilin protein [Rubrivivax sp. RP6-9]|uniref:type IV pilin protein n=1 Tax=Rubrivivax sp. RP6-9 TaxID=3415750 RepID=UPI003CC515E3
MLPFRAPPSSSDHGFTLIELLIALVVLAVLAAVALPAFNESIRKSRRSEAAAAITGVQQAQERWRSNNTSYAASVAALSLPTTSSGGYYTISVDSATTTGYNVVATAVAGKSQAEDGDCVRLRVRSVGGSLVYGSAAASGSFDESAGNRCWSR